jgi:hypothetical protein
MAAENGGTTNQLMTFFGREGAKEAERYTKAADENVLLPMPLGSWCGRPGEGKTGKKLRDCNARTET